MGRPLLFYSDWPLGYHNQEAERKAVHLAGRGYDVFYVAGVGIRNPRLSSLGKVVDRLGRKAGAGAAAAEPRQDGVRTASFVVAPPRQVPAVRALNARWVERQLRGPIGDWSQAVAWVRVATPELVDALDRLRPRAVVYEIVDAHHVTPGLVGPWKAIFEASERALVDRADVVVTTNRTLAPRFEAWGADLRYVPHGVELWPLGDAPPRGPAADPVLGFVGTLDRRLDVPMLRAIAEARPRWRIRLIGPVEQGFDPAELAGLANVSVEPPIPHERVGEVLAGFDVGLMPYADSPVYRGMSPLKNLELMAAGKPAVARPNPELEPYAGLVRFAHDGPSMVEQVELALAEDSPELVRRRREVAERSAWGPRLAELEAILDEVLARAPQPPRSARTTPGSGGP